METYTHKPAAIGEEQVMLEPRDLVLGAELEGRFLA